MKGDESQALLKLSIRLKIALQSVLGQKVDKIVGFALDENDNILGVGIYRNQPFQFEISNNNKISYKVLQLNLKSTESPNILTFEQSRTDGILLKKKCKVGIPCGSTCIPKGTVCQTGLPTASQAMTGTVRAILKGSSKLARAAGAIALAAGTSMIAAYAINKVDGKQVSQKINQAANSIGLSGDSALRLRKFTADVAQKAGASKEIVNEIAPRKTFKEEIRQMVKDYQQSWKTAPVKNSITHLSIGLMVGGSSIKAGEALGYIPEGSVGRTINNAIGAKAIKNRVNRFKSNREPYKIKTRSTSYGA